VLIVFLLTDSAEGKGIGSVSQRKTSFDEHHAVVGKLEAVHGRVRIRHRVEIQRARVEKHSTTSFLLREIYENYKQSDREKHRDLSIELPRSPWRAPSIR
jgi:hypothetical protein